MITLSFTFWMFMILFAIIGAMRGWAKELLVTFGVVLGLFIIAVIERFLPAVDAFLNSSSSTQFWVRSIVVLFLVIFGYQTPNLPRLPQARFARDRIGDSLLGFFIGALNGFLIVGTLWYYMAVARYPFQPHITPPLETPAIMSFLPPEILIYGEGGSTSPAIYFAVAVAFLFVIVVFI